MFDWAAVCKNDAALSLCKKGSCLSIGSFDGPHKGHSSLFCAVLKAAKEKNLVPGLLTFKQALPGLKHPKDYLGDISTVSERLFEYEKCGFEFIILVDFTKEFSNLKGEDFFSILKNNINLRFIAEGTDFKCGYKGLFGMNEIKTFANEHKIETVFIELVKQEHKRISSSKIRELIHEGKIKEANILLGHDFLLVPKNSFLVCKNVSLSYFFQVLPKNGTYNVLINKIMPATFTITENYAFVLPTEHNNEEKVFVESILFCSSCIIK